jgi:hypothetical protein
VRNRSAACGSRIQEFFDRMEIGAEGKERGRGKHNMYVPTARLGS